MGCASADMLLSKPTTGIWDCWARAEKGRTMIAPPSMLTKSRRLIFPLRSPLCFIAANRQRLGQHSRRDLPRHAPLVFAPAARTLLAAIADDGVPIAVGLGLILSRDLKREGFVVFERRTAVQANTRNAGNFE